MLPISRQSLSIQQAPALYIKYFLSLLFIRSLLYVYIYTFLRYFGDVQAAAGAIFVLMRGACSRSPRRMMCFQAVLTSADCYVRVASERESLSISFPPPRREQFFSLRSKERELEKTRATAYVRNSRSASEFLIYAGNLARKLTSFEAEFFFFLPRPHPRRTTSCTAAE